MGIRRVTFCLISGTHPHTFTSAFFYGGMSCLVRLLLGTSAFEEFSSIGPTDPIEWMWLVETHRNLSCVAFPWCHMIVIMAVLCISYILWRCILANGKNWWQDERLGIKSLPQLGSIKWMVKQWLKEILNLMIGSRDSGVNR